MQRLAHANWKLVLLLSDLNIIIILVRPFGTELEELGWEFIRALGISDLPSFQALPDEGDIVQGAAGLGAPLPSRVRRAGIVVGPGGQDRV